MYVGKMYVFPGCCIKICCYTETVLVFFRDVLLHVKKHEDLGVEVEIDREIVPCAIIIVA